MNKRILKTKLRNILIKEDPMGIYFPEDNNISEYDREIDMVIKILPTINSERDLLDLIYLLFQMRFGRIEAGEKEKYQQLTSSIWQEIKENKLN